ncbi:unnamed protein product [Clonostachys rosea]|uniref:Suppressor of anucleate metulae protein B n=1 Tax=Bionectria ochroleuca TaxID=29856 RepID=A0ABY6U4C9_BIOOC|nr:unnamed protein product [Clonostachys rosea]
MGTFMVWSLNGETPSSPATEEVEDPCDDCGQGNAQGTCYICNKGRFCRGLCNRRALSSKKHRCAPEPVTGRTTADDLYDDIRNDSIPKNPLVLKEYYFGNCKEPTQQKQLIFFYQIFRLHRWRKSKKIYDNSVTLFNEQSEMVPLDQVLWLRNNASMFNEEKTETLDEEVFARRGIARLFSTQAQAGPEESLES